MERIRSAPPAARDEITSMMRGRLESCSDDLVVGTTLCFQEARRRLRICEGGETPSPSDTSFPLDREWTLGFPWRAPSRFLTAMTSTTIDITYTRNVANAIPATRA